MVSKTAQKTADNLAAVLDKIPQMFGEDADIGLLLHEIIMEAAPETPGALVVWHARLRDRPVKTCARLHPQRRLFDFRRDRKGEYRIREGRGRQAHSDILVLHAAAG